MRSLHCLLSTVRILSLSCMLLQGLASTFPGSTRTRDTAQGRGGSKSDALEVGR